MTIFQEIEELSKEKFEKMWLKQKEQIQKTWNEFVLFSENLKGKKHEPNSCRVGFKYDFRHEDFAFYKIAPGKNYNTIKTREYNLIREFINFTITIERVGIEKYLEKEKSIWWVNMIAKLNKYTEKFLNLNDKFLNGTINTSPKGYVIVVLFKRQEQNMLFETQCFPAGGYNIQSYHFRYKGKIK